jgi:hypothetical protein
VAALGGIVDDRVTPVLGLEDVDGCRNAATTVVGLREDTQEHWHANTFGFRSRPDRNCGTARADRPVTDAERPRLVDAVAAQGCSGGKMEWDEGDHEFEVDDARCDGRKYELKFHADYSLKSKKLDE